MKKLIFIPLLIFSLTLSGQFTKSGGTFLKTGNVFMTATTPVVDFCAEFDTVYAAFDTKPHIDTAVFMNDLVYSLDTAGFWDRMDLFYVFCVHEQDDESLINWIHPGTFDADNPTAMAWTRYEGYQGANYDYLSTNYNPSTNNTNFGLDDASAGIYIISGIDEGRYAFGANDGTQSFRLQPRNSGNAAAYVNSSGVGVGANTDASGFWMITRTASNATAIYRNSTTPVDTDTDVSMAIPNAELLISTSTTSSGYSNNKFAIFFVMNGVTAAEFGRINTKIVTFLTAIGVI